MLQTDSISVRPIRVVPVDDHRTMLWGLCRLIESAAPAMELAGSASSGAELKALLPRAGVDVILLDLDLGSCGGIDLLPMIHEVCDAKVLVLTGNKATEAHEAALIRGARGVVCKDEPAETILRAIERVHDGEVWVNRGLMGRVLAALTRPASIDQSDPEAVKISSLTTREREIVAAIVRHGGVKGMVIAEALSISENTLRNHLSVIYDKLGVRNRLDLFAYASRHKLGER